MCKIKPMGIGFLLLLFFINVVTLNAQDVLTTTRSKLWYSSSVSGTTLGNTPYGTGTINHPGFYGAGGQTRIAGGGSKFSVWATINGELSQRGTDFSPEQVVIEEEIAETKNYNFSIFGPNYPEQILKGVHVESNSGVTFGPDMNFRIRLQMSTWSLPKYDDFVIQDFTFINYGTETLYNCCIMMAHGMQGPLAPSSSQINYDKEYIWDEQRNTFIFYDDNTKNPTTGTVAEWSNPKYQETGDVGNPGDLIEVGSPDQQLYAAQAYGFSFVSVPQNLNGNSDVQFVILNGDNFSILPNRNASQPEKGLETWRSVSETELYTKPDPIDQPLKNMFKFPNPKKSWRQSMADGEPNVSDWERSPVMMAGIGPYSIAPGDSIQFTLLYCAGEMDRQLSGYGGVDAIKQLDMDFLDSPDDHAAIKAFRANWDTAMELVDKKAQTGFYAIEENIPPPTAGDPPRIGSDNILTAEATSIKQQGGGAVSGIELTWIKVPDNYVDPITNVNDFAGYRVYRSDISRVGPWTEIAGIAKGNAQLDATGTRVVHSVESLAGVPYYYAVSTYDSEGNESAKTAYTYDPIGAKPAPQDENMDLVRVVPNPFRQVRDPLNPVDQKKLIFLNIPSKCTIRIYNLAGHHIRTLEHDDGFGEEAWGSTGTISDFMLTENRNNIQPGLYVYHIESHVQGHEGESVIGKFVVIK